MSLPKADYHMHTPLCGHAVGQPEEYVKRAIEIGLEEIGFSDHAPLVTGPDPRYTMNYEQLPVYLDMMEALKRKYASFSIKVALEMDYVPGHEKKLSQTIAAYPYDYIIGSIHMIDRWEFDDPDTKVLWENKDVDSVYRDYYGLLRQSAASGLFDIMGHVDLVKKFGHRPTGDMTAEIEKTAAVFKEAGVTVEINTSGLRKPVTEIYPSLAALKIYRRHQVPITFSSDSHDPMDVGRDFDKGRRLALDAGYSDYRIFTQRKVQRLEKL